MASRKRNKRGMSPARWIMTIIVIGLMVGIGLVAKNIVGLTIEKRALTQQNSELTNKRDDLTAELENVNDLDYIEEQARKLLHMIKPGEVLYILNGGNQRPEGGDTNIELPTQPNPTYSEEESSEDDGAEESYSEESYSEESYSEESYSEESYSEEGYSEEGYYEETSGEEYTEDEGSEGE